MTKSLEDYVETILILIHEHRVARVRDVAAALNVKMPSVVKALGELKKLALVQQEPYGDIELTKKGRSLAAAVLARHTVLKAFLLKLGVGEVNAERDACLMEHVVSVETMDRIHDFLGDMDPTRKVAGEKRPASAKTSKKQETRNEQSD